MSDTAAVRIGRARTTVELAGDRKELAMWRIIDAEMREQDRLRSIICLLRTELALYRPEHEAAEPAPKVDGYWLVTIAGRLGLCYAADVMSPYPVPGYGLPDFHHPATTTLCGKKTLHPGSIPGYGWPPATMTCAECRSKLPVTP